MFEGMNYWHPFSHVCVLTVVLHHWSAPQHQRSSWHALLWKLEDKTSLDIGNKCLYFIAQLKSKWALIDGACQIYPCFLQETFCSHRTLTVKKGGKCISNFFALQSLGCCLGYWLTNETGVAVMIIDWLTDRNWVNVLIIDWLTDWNRVIGLMTDWQTGRLADWQTGWLKLCCCLGYWLTDWLTQGFSFQRNCRVASVGERNTKIWDDITCKLSFPQ